jgi:hypothetical protein
LQRYLVIIALGIALSPATPACGASSIHPAHPLASWIQPGPSVPADSLRYDEVQQKSIHNAYDRPEPLLDQLVYHDVRSIELDLHTGRSLSTARPGEWFVYHVDWPWSHSTSCETFSDCLAPLLSFHRLFPKHEPLTVFLDLKDDLVGTHGAPALDRKLLDAFDDGALYAPRELVADCIGARTARDAVSRHCGWPTMGDLRGRVLFVLTGGDACDPGSRLGAYVEQGGRVAFLAPELSAHCSLETYARERPEAVFFNIRYDDVRSAADVERVGGIARVFYGGLRGGLDDQGDWDSARRAGAHFLVTDRVDARLDPWSTTESRSAPFTPLDGRDTSPVADFAGRVVTAPLPARSGSTSESDPSPRKVIGAVGIQWQR